MKRYARCQRNWKFGIYRNRVEFWFCVIAPKWVLQRVYKE